MRFPFSILVLGITAGACGESPVPSASEAPDLTNASVGAAAQSATAVISFGRDDVGSPFPPPSGHDRSFHAIDKVRPRQVNLGAGGTVTFQMGTFHQVAIYAPGTEPEDIDVTLTIDLTAPPPAPPGTIIIPDFLIDDPTNRLAQGPFSFAPMDWDSPAGTFDAPGTYLVICNVVPHFTISKMYAWVTVK
jgi:plastocyanin